MLAALRCKLESDFRAEQLEYHLDRALRLRAAVMTSIGSLPNVSVGDDDQT